VLHLKPELILTFGALIQISRLIGGEVGLAYVSTLARVREQHASNLIGQHLQSGSADVAQRVQVYSATVTRNGIPDANAGIEILARVVRSLATTQGVIDSFVVVAATAAFGMLILALLDPPPRGPASHKPLFGRGG